MPGPTACSPSSGNSRISAFTIIPSRSSGPITRTGATPTRSGFSEAGGNSMPLVVWIVVGDDKRSALAQPEFAHHSLVRAAKDLDDLSVGPAVVLDASNVD